MKICDENIIRIPKEGEVYRHFKGTLYEVVTVAVHTETSEKLVIYRSLENKERVFARPVEMFQSKVDHIKYPFVKAKYRFTLVEGDTVEENKSDEDDIKTEEIGTEEQKETAEEVQAETDIVDNKITDDIKNKEVDENNKDEYKLDPIVEKILDAKDYTEKIQNFDLLRGKCDTHMLSVIAISHDIELMEGTIDDQYAQILKNLKMHEKYETTRLR